MRIPQPRGINGSLKWIQDLVNTNAALLSDCVRSAAHMPVGWTVTWVSPLAACQWSEYRDADFLIRLGLDRLVSALEAFWPRLGPQWDALGRSSDGGVVLVEAKAHTSELASSCDAKGGSRALITRSTDAAKAAFGAGGSADWLNGYYQYANRLAHLHFLRQHGISAWLVFVYFVNDRQMKGPQSAAEWKRFLSDAYAALGFPPNHHLQGVCDVFLDVSTLPQAGGV